MKMNSPAMIKEACDIIETQNEEAYKALITELMYDVKPTHEEFGKMQELVAQEFIGRVMGKPISEQVIVFQKILPFIESVSEWYIDNFYVRYCQDLEYFEPGADAYESAQQFFKEVETLKGRFDDIAE